MTEKIEKVPVFYEILFRKMTENQLVTIDKTAKDHVVRMFRFNRAIMSCPQHNKVTIDDTASNNNDGFVCKIAL